MNQPIWEICLRLTQGNFRLDIDCRSDARVLGLYGASGSGKTTCLESIAGLKGGAEGRLRCNNQLLLDSNQGIRLSPEKRGIGYVPQEHLLFPHLNTRQNLEFGLKRTNNTNKATAIANEVIQVLELAHLLKHRVDQLSGGQRQRVALGRALCSAPRILLLDEPLASLDAPLRQRILPFLVKVREHFKLPILIVSHNPLELQALCGEVIALSNGTVLTRGTPIEVFTQNELYQSAAAEGFENIFPAIVEQQTRHGSTLRLGPDGAGPYLSVSSQAIAPKESLSVGLPASDILVATQTVKGLSARNHLPATIRELKSIDGMVVATALLRGIDLPPVVVELTSDAIEELELKEGQAVDLIIKSSSIAIYR